MTHRDCFLSSRYNSSKSIFTGSFIYYYYYMKLKRNAVAHIECWSIEMEWIGIKKDLRKVKTGRKYIIIEAAIFKFNLSMEICFPFQTYCLHRSSKCTLPSLITVSYEDAARTLSLGREFVLLLHSYSVRQARFGL